MVIDTDLVSQPKVLKICPALVNLRTEGPVIIEHTTVHRESYRT